MLKNLMVVAGCALAVVLAWRAGFGEASGGAEGLPRDVLRREPSAGRPAFGGLGVSSVVSPVTGKPGGVVTSGYRNRLGLDPRTPLGKAVNRLYSDSYGTPPLRIPRERIQAAVHQIIQNLKPEDIPALVNAFESVDDLGFRWALSFALQMVRDDRVVPALGLLFDGDPLRAGEALSRVQSDRAIEEIAAHAPVVDGDARRAVLNLHVMRSNWSGCDHWVDSLLASTSLSDYERLDAVTALGWRPVEEGLPRALDIALGAPQPLSEIGDLEKSHPSKDLRSGAVAAVMRFGDVTGLRKLFAAVDERGDEALRAMVDRNLITFATSGPDVSELIFERLEKGSRLSPGLIGYLAKVCGTGDISRIQALLRRNPDASSRRAIENAMIAAARR